MIALHDVRHLGRDRVIAAHELRGLVVDPGPASALDNWLGELNEAPRALLLTHIHLDHAGAAGVLARRFPGLRVYVHESGAPHLVDPVRLLASAARLYGAASMERLWGEVAPVPAEAVVALRGGERVEGMRVLYTPGHAGHHVCYLDEDSGDAFVGDVAGVRIPPGGALVMPTPPPEIDVEAWLDSIEAVRALGPARLRLTHFGAFDDAETQLTLAAEALRRQAELARDGHEAFIAGLEARIAAAGADGEPERLRQAAPLEQLWLGLERYWKRRG